MTERRQIPLSLPDADPHLCTPIMRHRVVSRQALFSGLDSSELDQIDRRCRAVWFNSGDAIYREEEAATNIYFVAIGLVKLTRSALDGRETVINLGFEGDFLGALPALGQEAYSENAWAMSPSCLLTLASDDFDAILRDFPSVALAALKGVSKSLTSAREAVHRLSGAAPLEQRLAATLLWLAGKVGESWDEGTLLQVPLAREDLAAIAGSAPESVSRLLSAWRRAGLVRTGRRWIALEDVPALVALRDGA